MVWKFYKSVSFSSPISAKETDDTTVWSIPLKILTDQGEDSLLFDKKSFAIFHKSEWMKVNSGESSFVRVQYPKKLLEALKPAIETCAISPLDKLGILRDTFAVAEAGFGSTVDALSLSTAYTNEREYVIWTELAVNMHKNQ